MLFDREKVRQNLRRMELVGQAVPHGNGSILCQLLHDLLPVAPVLDAVIHAGKNTGRVGDAFLFPDLGTGGVEVGDPHAQIMARHLKGAAGAGAGLLKDQGDVLSLVQPVGNPCLFLRLELGGKVQQTADFIRCIVKQGKKISSVQVHGCFSFYTT